MGLPQDYLIMQKKYEAQYGERTVVLMQVGTFFECYSYDITCCSSPEARIDKEGRVWNESIGNAPEISMILNSVLTHEDGNEPYSISNPYKVGFPVISWEKNRDTLMNNDYTVIRVDQEKGGKPTKGPMNRFVAEICSPTMQIDTISPQRATSNIACIYVEYQQGNLNRLEDFLITTGAAVVDVLTGQNRVCEFYSKAEDQVHAVQELYRFLIAHNPRELIVHVADMPPGLDTHTDERPNPYIKYLEKVLELRRFDRLNTYVNAVPADYKKLPYQIEFLNKIFNKKPEPVHTTGIRMTIIQKRNERIIEEMGLERMNYGRVAYMLLMQHCYSYNADIITKLSKPDLQWIDGHKHLVLTHNAIVQLHLMPVNEKNVRLRKRTEIDSLMSVLDQNQTHLGRRLLQTLLQNPMSNPADISIYYDMVSEMMAAKIGEEDLWLVLDRQLRELPDIGRIQRKLEIKLINPKEMAVLFGAYLKLINIYMTVSGTKSPTLIKQMFTRDEVTSFNGFIQRYATIFNFEALECCSIDSSAESDARWLDFVDCPIRPGAYPDLDTQTQSLEAAENALQQMVDHLNMFLGTTRGKKLEFRSAKKKVGARKQDPTGTILATTVAKATTLLNSNYDRNLCGNIQALPYTAGENLITSDRIVSLCTHIDNTRMWMRQRLLIIYESLLEEMTTKYNFYVAVANLVAKLDLIHSYAKVSFRYNYYRPDIITETGDVSYMEAKEIRHPIIERLIDGAYVTNDLYLGNGQEIKEGVKENVSTRSNGVLLYGVNQTGKSSLVAAAALNIIMAQIGCFVPSKLRYKPYSKIITRLSGDDNIFKGQSSFAVEMTELRTILRQTDSNTLVIGDELSSGTESYSGMAITGSAIISLVEARTSFIFATHMHELLDLSSIKSLPKETMRICHLSISYDEVSKNLIYDRRLKDGSGPSIYGLLVARSLDLPKDFLDRANMILSEITGNNKELVDTTSSRYNSKLYVDVCAKCGRSKAQTELHTHHIIEQKFANEKSQVDKVIQGSNGELIKIGTMNVHAKDNLIVLCRDCHVNLHRTGQELETMAVPNGKIIRMKPDIPTAIETPKPMMLSLAVKQ